MVTYREVMLDNWHMDLVYDDVPTKRNLIACDKMPTEDRPLHDRWVHYQLMDHLPQVHIHSLTDKPEKYVYPIGLFHAPWDWTVDPGPFGWLPDQVLRDAQAGRVLFVMDQAQEGYTETVAPWMTGYDTAPSLWQWFYENCAAHGINPRQILYLTSDHQAEHTHAAHCHSNNVSDRIQVISSLFNLHVLSHVMRHNIDIPILETAASKPKLFNCLNRNLHQHRRWFFCKMLRANLLDRGMISMPLFTEMEPLPGVGCDDDTLLAQAQQLLPLVVDLSDFNVNMFNNLNTNIYRDSWFSVITETFVSDNQLLLGEKVFKPMMCGSPFMLLSTRGSLARLRKLGFRTFPMLWDESYDLIDDIGDRMDAIIMQMQKISRIKDLAGWIAQADSALAHNHRLAWQNWEETKDFQRILAIWLDFVA